MEEEEEEESPFVAHVSKKQRKKRERAEQRQRGEETAAAAAAERAAKQARPSPGLLDNAAYVAVFGSEARGSVLVKPEYGLSAGRFHLSPAHLQLLVGVAGGAAANHAASPFVFAHQSLIRRLVVVSLGGLTLDLVDQPLSAAMQEMFPFGHSALVGPGSQSKAYHVPPMVLRIPAARAAGSSGKNKKREKERPANLAEVLASPEELAANEFPLAEGPDALASLPPFVSTKSGIAGVPIAALDCEMVSTATGLELGRVSLVGSDLQILLDSFVAPTNAVLDYNTRFSGLTEEALRGAPPLEQVRELFLTMVGENTVLAGHSLDNDLRSLRVVHRRVADTSLLFPHTRGPPYKRSLRDLVAAYLQETIQDGEHCSVQDAAAAMRLLQLKMSKGVSFGVPTKEFVSLWETVRDKSGALIMTSDLAEPLRAVTGEGIGAAQLHNTAASAEEALELAGRPQGTLTYVLLPDCSDPARLRVLAELLRALVWQRLPPGTLLAVHGGRGSLARLLELQAARQGPADDAAIAAEALRIRTLPFWMHVTH